MHTIVKSLVLIVLVIVGCHPIPIPKPYPSPRLVPTSRGSLPSALGYDIEICGYQLVRKQDQPPRRQYLCWHRWGEFACKECRKEPRLHAGLTPPAEAKAGQPLSMKIWLRNDSKTTLGIDLYGTPFAYSAYGRTIYMRCDGNDEVYQGGETAQILRGKVDRSKYLTIPPGGTFEREIDIQGYEWARGACFVHWNGVLPDVVDADHPPAPDAPDNPVVVDCNWAFLLIEP